MLVALDKALLAASALVLVSVITSKLSERFGVPSLLVFVALGMLSGPEAFGLVAVVDPAVAQSVGVVALAYILFFGGVSTDWEDVRPIVAPGISLATIGVLLTALAMGAFARMVLGFSWLEGLLLGAIVSSTDAAAVFSILRSRNVALRGSLRPLLELESGSNDPMAVFLTIGLLHLVEHPDTPPVTLLPFFLVQMGVGGAVGFASGRLLAYVLNRIRLAHQGLYPVFTIGFVPFVYALVAGLGASGFLAVYVAGLALGERDFMQRGTIVRFHDGIAWLMQIAMFLALGLLALPSHVLASARPGALAAAFLILVARPLSALVSLAPFRDFTQGARLLVAWVGLRGAAPIVLATFPLLAGIDRAGTIFNIVFFAVIASVIVQGPSLPYAARFFGVSAPFARLPRPPLRYEPTADIRWRLIELQVLYGSPAIGRPVVELGLPHSCLLVLVGREARYVVPSGDTLLEPGDIVLALAEPEDIEPLRAALGARVVRRRRY